MSNGRCDSSFGNRGFLVGGSSDTPVSDELVKVSATDSVPGLLSDKLIVDEQLTTEIVSEELGGCPLGKTFKYRGVLPSTAWTNEWNGSTVNNMDGSISVTNANNNSGNYLLGSSDLSKIDIDFEMTVATANRGEVDIFGYSSTAGIQIQLIPFVDLIYIDFNKSTTPQVTINKVISVGVKVLVFVEFNVSGNDDRVIITIDGDIEYDALIDLTNVAPFANNYTYVRTTSGTTTMKFNKFDAVGIGFVDQCEGLIINEQLKISYVPLFALNFVFQRATLQGNYSSGELELPYVAFIEDGTQVFPKQYGVDVTVDSFITVANFQFADIAVGSEFQAFMKITDVNNITTKTIISDGTNLLTVANDGLHQEYIITQPVFKNEFVIFGVERVTGTGTIPIVGATCTAYIRTEGA